MNAPIGTRYICIAAVPDVSARHRECHCQRFKRCVKTAEWDADSALRTVSRASFRGEGDRALPTDS